jgi:hypothetical protein
VVFSRTDRTEVVFFFNATELGEYSFVFSNERKSARKSITIAIDIVTPVETIATPEDLDPSDLSMKRAQSVLHVCVFASSIGARSGNQIL